MYSEEVYFAYLMSWESRTAVCTLESAPRFAAPSLLGFVVTISLALLSVMRAAASKASTLLRRSLLKGLCSEGQ